MYFSTKLKKNHLFWEKTKCPMRRPLSVGQAARKDFLGKRGFCACLVLYLQTI